MWVISKNVYKLDIYVYWVLTINNLLEVKVPEIRELDKILLGLTGSVSVPEKSWKSRSLHRQNWQGHQNTKGHVDDCLVNNCPFSCPILPF
jgi:hypothetical protein